MLVISMSIVMVIIASQLSVTTLDHTNVLRVLLAFLRKGIRNDITKQEQDHTARQTDIARQTILHKTNIIIAKYFVVLTLHQPRMAKHPDDHSRGQRRHRRKDFARQQRSW